MEGSGERRGKHDTLGRRGTWFDQLIGEGWTEVEPGIYRLDADAKNDTDARTASPSRSASERDLLEALKPAEGEPDSPQPSPADTQKPQQTRRLFG